MRTWHRPDDVDPQVWTAAVKARKPGTHLEVVNATCVRIVNDGASNPKRCGCVTVAEHKNCHRKAKIA